MSRAPEVPQRLDELKSLRARLGPPAWRAEDWGLVDRLLESYERVLSALLEAQITLQRLRRLVFGTRRRRRNRSVAGVPASAAGGGN